MTQSRIAIAHDYLTQRGGAEKVVLTLARGFPKAPIQTTLFSPDETYPEFRDLHIKTTGLNRFGLFRRHHRFSLPFLARSVSRTQIDADVTIVSSSGWAHGFSTAGRKIVYCYSPARWLYQRDIYVGSDAHWAQRALISLLGPGLRRWDKRQAQTADVYLAISTVVQRRIFETYGIEAEVVPAPHSFDATGVQAKPISLDPKKRFYLCVSRLLPYKNVDAVVAAFEELNEHLVVVGRGPEERKLREQAPTNVTFLKDLSDAEMRWLYSRCRAVVAASYEDFGLTPIEAGVFGKPAIALRWGGFLDTIKEGMTGLYFDEPDSKSIATTIRISSETDWDADAIRQHAQSFSEEAFLKRIQRVIESTVM